MNKVDQVDIQEFRIEEVPPSSSWIIIGPPHSGKTTLLENLLYYNRDKFPVAKAFIGNEDGYNKFCKILGKLFVMNYYDEEEHKKFVDRQRFLASALSDKRAPGFIPNCACIFDDVGDVRTIFKNGCFSASVKIGTQHWKELFVIATQDPFDVPPPIRDNVSYVAIGRIMGKKQRERVFEVCGAIFGDFKRFSEFIDQICEKHTFMIVLRNGESNRLEDCVFWYKTKPLETDSSGSPTWKFGCREYREWNKLRYNAEYTEELGIDYP